MGDLIDTDRMRIQQILCENERRDLSTKVRKEFHLFWQELEYLNEDIYQMIARSMMDKYPRKIRKEHVSIWDWGHHEAAFHPSECQQGELPYDRAYDKYKFWKKNRFTLERVYFMTREEGEQHCFDYER